MDYYIRKVEDANVNCFSSTIEVPSPVSQGWCVFGTVIACFMKRFKSIFQLLKILVNNCFCIPILIAYMVN